MELLKTKARIKLARKGHKLLKQKRDALIMEFFKILGKARDLRGELSERMKRAYRTLSKAQQEHSTFELEGVAAGMEKELGLEVHSRNIMGVRIPEISSSFEKKPYLEKGYSIIGTSAAIDAVVDDFEEALKIAITLAETETAIRRLILEIEKTKRRVNALEYVLLPKMEKQKTDIMMRLEEAERDSFVSLKVIKRRLEKEGAS